MGGDITPAWPIRYGAKMRYPHASLGVHFDKGLNCYFLENIFHAALAWRKAFKTKIPARYFYVGPIVRLKHIKGLKTMPKNRLKNRTSFFCGSICSLHWSKIWSKPFCRFSKLIKGIIEKWWFHKMFFGTKKFFFFFSGRHVFGCKTILTFKLNLAYSIPSLFGHMVRWPNNYF